MLNEFESSRDDTLHCATPFDVIDDGLEKSIVRRICFCQQVIVARVVF